MKRAILFMAALLTLSTAQAQYVEPARRDTVHNRIFKGIEYNVEAQGSFSGKKTPLWLNANKYGLSSLEKNNGYLRGSIERPLSNDEGRKWGLGYGLDVAVGANYTSTLIIQQAYVEGRWWHGTLTIGAKQEPMELKDNELSSGSQTLGINSRPVPQVRIALPDYWTIPIFNGWLHLKGHIAYGIMTDKNWQHDFSQRRSRYADNVLYHSKAGYLKIGNEEVFCPWSVELGLEMASTFGGDTYLPNGDGTMQVVKNAKNLKSFINAFIPGGGETIEQGTAYVNDEGNQLGSWLARINYEADSWRFSVYADKYFEDHSAMFQLDYDGYGTGNNWNVKEKHRYFLYDFKDWMLGLSYQSKYNRALTGITFEYIYSKYQSGPIYHDHTKGWSEHISGRDNFYNHYLYPGWQHWGQVIGNPLYRSPLYNDDGAIDVQDSRFMAFHLGLNGRPQENIYYRLLASWQEGLGTYEKPYTKKRHNFSWMLEGKYTFMPVNEKSFFNGVSVKAAYGMDFGSILGGINYGFQLTISKSGIFNL